MRQLKITKSITERESQSLEKYLQEIGKVDLLTPEEEVDLAKRAKQGDQVAIGQLTKANLRFVVSVAKQYQNQGLALSDLINEGNLGLIKAVGRFDVTRGFKLISYAVRRIRQSILQAIAEQSRTVRLPLNRVGNINKLINARSRFEQDNYRDPTADELADILELPEKHILLGLDDETRRVSFDSPLLEDGSTTMIDTYIDINALSTDHEISQNESLQKDLASVLSTLTSKQSEVIKLRFGIGYDRQWSLDDIGDHMGLTRERVRQIQDKAIYKLRSASRSGILEKYLGT